METNYPSQEEIRNQFAGDYRMPSPFNGQQIEKFVDGITPFLNDGPFERRDQKPPANENEQLKRINSTLVWQNQKLTAEVANLQKMLDDERHSHKLTREDNDFHIADKKNLRETVKSLQRTNALLVSRMEMLEMRIWDYTRDEAYRYEKPSAQVEEEKDDLPF